MLEIHMTGVRDKPEYLKKQFFNLKMKKMGQI